MVWTFWTYRATRRSVSCSRLFICGEKLLWWMTTFITESARIYEILLQEFQPCSGSSGSVAKEDGLAWRLFVGFICLERLKISTRQKCSRGLHWKRLIWVCLCLNQLYGGYKWHEIECYYISNDWVLVKLRFQREFPNLDYVWSEEKKEEWGSGRSSKWEK